MNDKEGLQFLKEALETAPDKKLGRVTLIDIYGVPCAIGRMMLYKGIDPLASACDSDGKLLNWYDQLGISDWLIGRIYQTNDDTNFRDETREQRYERMLTWVNRQLELIDEQEAHELGG